MPACGERSGLRLAVADHADDQQVGVVECGSVGVEERIAELAALVDRTGGLRCGVARDPSREGELAEQPPQPFHVLTDAVVDLAVGAFEVGVRDDTRAPVTRAGDEDRVQLASLDHAVHVRVDEVQPGRRSPVAEQARLDVIGP